MARIVVVGSANVDFVVQTPHIPVPGETVLGRDFVMVMGGKGANQAVGCARLGGAVTFVSRVGADVFGAQCRDAYQRESIDIQYIQSDPAEATGVALIAVAEDGENSITVASGANMQLSPDDVAQAAVAFQAADVLLMQLEIPLETVIAAARLAKAHGVRIVLNPAPARPLPAELLELVDVITPNRIELAQLMGVAEDVIVDMSHAELAERVRRLGPAQAVITLGGEGALVVSASLAEHVSAFAINPVDTTAAGDAFNAGLAVAWCNGGFADLSQAARYANACGALAATQVGAQSSLPQAVAVEVLLDEQAL